MEQPVFPIENFHENVVNLFVTNFNKVWCFITRKNYTVFKRALAIKAVQKNTLIVS